MVKESSYLPGFYVTAYNEMEKKCPQTARSDSELASLVMWENINTPLYSMNLTF